MKCFVLPLVILSALPLSNCVSVGTKDLDRAEKLVALEKGVSTKVQVYELFGQPADVNYAGAAPSSQCLWTFFKADIGPSGWTFVPFVGAVFCGKSEENMKALVSFDSKGKFTNITSEKDTSYSNSWLEITRDAYRRKHDPKGARVKAEMDRLGKPFDAKFAKDIGERRWTDS